MSYVVPILERKTVHTNKKNLKLWSVRVIKSAQVLVNFLSFFFSVVQDKT